MYNNKTTYSKVWDTERARKYDKKLITYFNRTLCMSDCPLGWAEDVYLFLKDIDKKFGIGYTESNAGYYWKGTPLKNIFLEPLRYLFKSYQPKVSIARRINQAVHALRYGLRQLVMTNRGKIYNKLFKPEVYLSQVKEKYGTLRVYFSTEDFAVQKYIDNKIDMLEFKLAQKGCYFSPVNMMGWGSCFNTNFDDDYEVKVNKDNSYEVIRHTYRSIARNLLTNEEYKELMRLYADQQAIEKAKDDAAVNSDNAIVEFNKDGKETK